jgi:hypothetical protein
MKMSEYMKRQRKLVPVEVNGIVLKINENKLLKINAEMLKINENELLKINSEALKINKPLLKINAEMLKINSKNGDFEQISPFCKNYTGVGGVGGVIHNNTYNSSNTDNVVKSTIVSKEKIIIKKKERKRKNYIPEYSEDFQKIWNYYPRHEGTSKCKAFESWERAANLPGLDSLIACIALEKEKDQWQEESKIPHLATWLNQRRWESYPDAKIAAKAARMKGAGVEKIAPRIIPKPEPTPEEIEKGREYMRKALGISEESK